MSESLPKVSIVLPTHNGAKYIGQSIDSCLNQTYKDIELIIVDDGSTDNTPEVIKAYKHEQIKYIRHQKNMGLADALNTGFANSIGEYLTWTSDDNFFHPRAIESMFNLLQTDKNRNFVYANYYLVDENANITRTVSVGAPKKLDIINCIGPCFLYRRRVYGEIGEFNPQAFLVEDYEYWLRIRSKKIRMLKLNKYLYYYRIHKDSLFMRYSSEKTKEKREEIRDKYLTPAKRYYFAAEKYYQKNDRSNSRKLLIKSLSLNPIYLNSWRLLIILFLNPSIVKRIKSIRNAILKARSGCGKHKREYMVKL